MLMRLAEQGRQSLHAEESRIINPVQPPQATPRLLHSLNAPRKRNTFYNAHSIEVRHIAIDPQIGMIRGHSRKCFGLQEKIKMDICNILVHLSLGVPKLPEPHEPYQQCSLIILVLRTLVVHSSFSRSPCYYHN